MPHEKTGEVKLGRTPVVDALDNEVCEKLAAAGDVQEAAERLDEDVTKRLSDRAAQGLERKTS